MSPVTLCIYRDILIDLFHDIVWIFYCFFQINFSPIKEKILYKIVNLPNIKREFFCLLIHSLGAEETEKKEKFLMISY